MAIAFVNKSTTQTGTSATPTYAIDPTGANILWVGISIRSTRTITVAPTFNGVTMTQAGSTSGTTGITNYLYYLVSPAQTSANVTFTQSASDTFASGASWFSGARLTVVPEATSTQSSITTTSFSQSVTTVSDNSFSVLWGDANGGLTLTAGTNTTIANQPEVAFTGAFMLYSTAAHTPAGSSALTVTSASQTFGACMSSFAPEGATSLPVNLISYWKLDESSGNAADSVGSNTLTNTGSMPYAVAKINNGADFVPDDSLNNATVLASTSYPRSFSLWANFDTLAAAGGDQAIMTLGDDVTHYYELKLRDSDNKIVFRSNNATEAADVDTGITAVADTWYHIVVVQNSNVSVTIYVNNVKTNTAATTFIAVVDKFWLGYLGRGGFHYMDGQVDEVGIWSRALSATEVSMLYNGGNGSAYPFDTVAQLYAYPFADGGDASVYASDGSAWATARNATTGTIRSGNYAQSTLSGATRFIERTFFTFDTSLIPDTATITSATLYLYITSISNANSPSYRLYDSTHADTIIAGDYDLVGTTEQSGTYLTSPSTSAYSGLTLNAAGLASINKTGYTKFCLREAAYDLANSQPSGTNFIQIADSDTANDPYIEINYTLGSPSSSVSPSPSISPSASISPSSSVSASPSPSQSADWTEKQRSQSTWTEKTRNSSSWTEKTRS